MRNAIAVFVCATLIFCSGCIVRSLHPLYSENDLVFDPAMLGEWAEEGGKEVWKFSRGEGKGYICVQADGMGNQGSFRAHLAKIGDRLFLDLAPMDHESKGTVIHEQHFLAVHSFLYVEQIEPMLRMRAPDLEWLANHMGEHPDAIRHEKIDGEILLTAATDELQAFWLKHLETEGAFGKASAMARRELSTKSGDAPRVFPLLEAPVLPPVLEMAAGALKVPSGQ